MAFMESLNAGVLEPELQIRNEESVAVCPERDGGPGKRQRASHAEPGFGATGAMETTSGWSSRAATPETQGGKTSMKNRTWFGRLAAIVATGLAALPALAAYDVNIPPPATPVSAQIYDLHMGILIVCTVIFFVVFGAMFYSIFKFRKSQGAKPDVNFHESTVIEIIWTVIPFIILIGIAIPSAKAVLDMKDASHPDLTIKVTGFQWGWRYDYSADDFGFYSYLKTPWSQIGQPGIPATEARGPDYLLEVDNEMVVPVNKRVRMLITSADVIHGWYVPQLGINQYGIPGFIKDAWFKAERVGVFKGQCSQICGKLHGYMPITVRVVSEADYAKWLADAKAKWTVKTEAVQAAAPPEDVGKTYALDELKSMGERVYAANCVACHQANGKGMPPAFPALAGSKVVLATADKEIDIVLNGKAGTAMQPFKQLSNTDLAAVITYTKHAFGNNVGKVVQPAEVKAARK
jgi:cytochrome c oxidase subunit II